jgi:hypothetical protein
MSKKVDLKLILLAFEVKNRLFSDFFRQMAAPAVGNFCQFRINILIDNILLYLHKNFQAGF